MPTKTSASHLANQECLKASVLRPGAPAHRPVAYAPLARTAGRAPASGTGKTASGTIGGSRDGR